MSRRARLRAQAQPRWEEVDDLPTHAPDQEEDDDTSSFYLANGDRIDTRSAWAMPGQQEQR
ncbi:hypothetical protein SAMN05216359_105330 [Roseateles sp. YR242]|uniref:hypothetical protein n=1 Tax=Roseateles sp. YR242 TaxID=1855305 RepID=UPI0008CA3594|nr:hypothetical protein [Roseateles sp. YR242]SEL13637.1 hypothetical protein SAMN05216359_105330 [Roseateles sp. YR242]